MNGKKAKALRREARFHPAAPREYDSEQRSKLAIFMYGKGTITATGPRRRYQDLKRGVQ